MTKLRQPDPFHQQSSLPFKVLPSGQGRDDSPVSVIPHSPVISHPSSSCASMEHQTIHDSKLRPCQDSHGSYSTSEDDGTFSHLALPHQFLKVGALESLPEAHSFPPMAWPKKLEWFLDDPAHHEVNISIMPTSENKELSSETDSVGSGLDTSEESSADHFSIFWKENDEASIFFPRARGDQDNATVIRPDLWKDGSGFLHEESIVARHVGFSAACKRSERGIDQNKSDEQSAGNSLAVISTPTYASERYWHQLKATNANVSIKRYVKGVVEKDSPNQDPREIVNSVANPSSASGSFTRVQNLGRNQIISPLRGVVGGKNNVSNQTGGSCMSEVLPYKWNDAEKWLVKANSPSQHQLRNGLSAAPTKLSYVISRSKSNTLPGAIVPLGRQADCSFSNCETVEANNYLGHSKSPSPASTSDGELIMKANSDQNRALLRSGFQEYNNKQQLHGERLARLEAGRAEVMHKLNQACVGGGISTFGRKETLKVQANERRNIGMEPNKESQYGVRNCNDGTQGKQVSIMGTDYHDAHNEDQAALAGVDVSRRLPLGVYWNVNSNTGNPERGHMQVGMQPEIFTQDKFADMVVKTFRQGAASSSSSALKPEFVVQTPRHGRSASMKDASTEISPTLCKRDMGTQSTPFGSSRASRSDTPAKNNSPARHNTPVKRSSSGHNKGVNLLELQSCHLAKLELQDLPTGTQFQPFDQSQLSNWSTREEEEEQSATSLRSSDLPDLKFNILEARASAWENAERAKYTVNYKREEARIDAWENLQRAKAEADLKKLEVKLEKLRWQATEKIMSKLTVALKRAQEMRATADSQQAEQVARIAERAASIGKNGNFPGSLGVCFARKLP